MRQTHLLLFVTSSLLGTAAFASSERFVGPAVAIGASVGFVQNEVTTTQDYKTAIRFLGGTHYDKDHNVQGSTLPLVDASWSWRLAPTWTAGAGINLETAARKGPYNVLSTWSLAGRQESVLKLKQHTSVYGFAGKQLGSNWLLYGKLGYHQAKAESAILTSMLGGTSSTDTQQSRNLRGVGAGIGATREWENGLQLRMETEYITFKSYTHVNAVGTPIFTAKPTMTRMNVLLGYRF